jgi:uroporphyrinogen decarboxylase
LDPRERVLAAIAGKETFPVPVDVFENYVYPTLEADLCRRFGLHAQDHEGVLKGLGAHMRWGAPAYVGPPLEDAPVQPPSAFPARKATRNIWGSWDGMNTYYEGIDRPLRAAETVAEIDAYPWPSPDWFDYGRLGWFKDGSETPRPVAEWAERHRDYARILVGFNPVFSRIMDLCGMETGLMRIAARPDLIHAMVAHIGEFLEEYYRRVAWAGRDHADFLGFGDDFAGQQGLLLNPQRWREYFLPLWRRLFAVAHEHGLKTQMHMCGAVRPVLGDLIDAGLDVFEVVQITAVGMDPRELKQEFGAHVAFYGGLDTQQVLPCGKPADVRREVRRLIEDLAKGGGYILASMHILMDDVPAENVLAMYEEARSYAPYTT